MRRGITYRASLIDGFPFIYDIDGNKYHYVTIGTQQWIIENFRSTKYINGTAIPNVTLTADWLAEDGTAGHDGAYCAYDNNTLNISDYGLLYNWYAVANINALAPVGWRVPSDVDMITLLNYSGGTLVAGGKLKETGLKHWIFPNGGATDEYNFKALPGGYRNNMANQGEFYFKNYYCRFWTSQALHPNSRGFGFSYGDSQFSSTYFNRRHGFSIRLMRDVA